MKLPTKAAASASSSFVAGVHNSFGSLAALISLFWIFLPPQRDGTNRSAPLVNLPGNGRAFSLAIKRDQKKKPGQCAANATLPTSARRRLDPFCLIYPTRSSCLETQEH
jgi:hypothetical protein